MATVRHMDLVDGVQAKAHGDVKATVRLVEVAGERFVQIDTFGSASRQEVGKQSQSVRLSKSAFEQLIRLGSKHF